MKAVVQQITCRLRRHLLWWRHFYRLRSKRRSRKPLKRLDYNPKETPPQQKQKLVKKRLQLPRLKLRRELEKHDFRLKQRLLLLPRQKPTMKLD